MSQIKTKFITDNAITNAKLATMAANTVKANKTGGSAAPTDVALSSVTEATSSVLTITNGSNVVVGSSNLTIEVAQASTSVSGYLSSTDFTTFNNKQAAGSYITSLTGDVTGSGPGATTATISSGAITNAKVNASANIDFSKLASLTSANILLGSAGNVATSTAVTGDLTISNTGVTAIGTNKVANTMLAQMAAHTFKGNNTGSTANALDLSIAQMQSELGVPTSASPLSLLAGGTGISAGSANAAFNALSPLTTKGDILSFSTVNARLGVGSDGQVLTADSTQTLGVKWATPTSGGLTYTTVTGTTQTLAVNNGYIANNASVVTFTLPTTSAVGDVITIVGKGAGGWIINSNAAATSQSINSGSSASAVSSSNSIPLRGSVSANDAITIVCVTANSVWNAISNVGTSGAYITATGGTITTDGNFKVHTFTSSGTFQITGGAGAVENLVIAGGGGGGGNGGGGGGAGGYVYNTPGSTMNIGSYTVTIGAGGGGGSNVARGGNGSNSVFDSITATGGGGGGYPGLGTGQNGGSGGGGGGVGGQGSPSTGGTASQGFAGGTGSNSGAGGGGGGGGAGAVGGNGANNVGGNGGNGLSNSITGAAVSYAGGGGGVGDSAGAGTGGTGGGGAGVVGSTGTAGTANRGGGGGGTTGANIGGAGGSGVVILRYRFQ